MSSASMYKKRKRSADLFDKSIAAYYGGRKNGQTSQKKRRMFKPGYDRVGGYYGRYAGRDGELKFFDVTLDDAVVAAGFNVTATVNAIPQGVTESERVGRKCTIRSIHWRIQCKVPEMDAQATPNAGDTIRVVMYLDHQANGATAANTDLFESNDWQSFRNLANTQRFEILYDRMVNVNYFTLASDGAGLVSSAEWSKDLQFHKKCNIPLEFSSTTGVIGEIRSNNIGVMLGGKNNIGGFNSQIRLRYSDN